MSTDGAALDAVELRLVEARKAHARGWPVTPLRGKKPYLKGWTTLPPPDFTTTEAWARAGNVGLRTGEPSGVVVIDDDTPDGSGSAKLYLPITPTVITGSGKKHHYFKRPQEVIKNSAGRLGDHVDVRGDGGQVVYPGSIHPETGQPYRWAPGLSPDDVPLADLPMHIIDLLAKKRKTKASGDENATADDRFLDRDRARMRVYVDAALRNAMSRMSGTPEGSRNEQLNREAYGLGRLIATGLVTREEITRGLQAAAEHAGLSADEASKTIASGLAAGESAPRDAAEFFGTRPTARSAAPRPVILVAGGDLPDVVDQAEEALLRDGGEELFEYAGLVVRLARTVDPVVAAGVMRAIGALAIRVVDVTYMVERFTLAAEFEKPGRKTTIPIDCPEKVAKTYLGREGRRKLRVLTGIIEAPTLRADGSVLEAPGYDADTGLYLDLGSTTFPPVPVAPTKEDAARALDVLKRVIEKFPFVADSDRSAALSAILTATIRRSLRTAPMLTFSAPMPGSGKSLLTDLASMIATGRPCAVMSQGKDEDENRKRMLALLLDGESVACIDNVERPLGSAALCSVLTQVVFKDRVLGFSKTAKVSTNITLFANGNNLTIEGDLTTRVVPCELDPRCENPEQRHFAINLYDFVPAHRGELVVAALTVLRAFHVAGRPAQNLPVFGRFETWSNWVRSALVWLGEVDPCAGLDRIQRNDPVREVLANVLIRWHDQLGVATFTVAEVLREAAAKKPQSTDGASLFEALWAVAPIRGSDQVDAKRLGHWLAKHANRVAAGLRIERVGDRKGSALWRVVAVDQTVVGSAGSAGSEGATSRADASGAASSDETVADSSSESIAEKPPKPQIPPMSGDNPDDLADDEVSL